MAFSPLCGGERPVIEKSLSAGAALRACDGADVVRRSKARRRRFLLALPGNLSATGAGRLGELTGMDTPTPSMLVDWGAPRGRLRLQGRFVHPRDPLLWLAPHAGTRKQPPELECEDVFDSVLVFDSAVWVGTAEANPSMAPLPLPAELTLPAAGAAPASFARPPTPPDEWEALRAELSSDGAPAPSGTRRRPARRSSVGGSQESQGSGGSQRQLSDESDGSGESDKPAVAARRAPMRKPPAPKRQRDESDGSDESDKPAVVARRAKPKRQRRRVESSDESDGSDGSDKPAVVARRASPRKPPAPKRRRRVESSDESDESDGSEEQEDSEEESEAEVEEEEEDDDDEDFE